MPCLLKPNPVLFDHCDNATNLTGTEPAAIGDSDRAEPDLDRRLVPVGVDMQRLVRFMAEEIEP
jgi:hypothetical protein